ncbi:GNAT family N-acetyltransferase [Actinocorallia lasiicapitis]
MSDVKVSDDTARSQYEIHVDGQLAGFSRYVVEGNTISFHHTEIDLAYEGQGLGSELVKSALSNAHSRGLKITATCPFVREYLKRHPEIATS